MRLFGRARVMPIEECPYAEKIMDHPARDLKSPRQVFEVEVEKTMTSCGYGVPVMQLVRQRRVVDRGRRYKEPQRATGT